MASNPDNNNGTLVVGSRTSGAEQYARDLYDSERIEGIDGGVGYARTMGDVVEELDSGSYRRVVHTGDIRQYDETTGNGMTPSGQEVIEGVRQVAESRGISYEHYDPNRATE